MVRVNPLAPSVLIVYCRARRRAAAQVAVLMNEPDPRFNEKTKCRVWKMATMRISGRLMSTRVSLK